MDICLIVLLLTRYEKFYCDTQEILRCDGYELHRADFGLHGLYGPDGSSRL